jgi:hypothetical protein
MEGVRGLEIGRTRANARVEENIGYYYEQTENQLVGAGTNIAQLKFPVGLFLRLSYDRLNPLSFSGILRRKSGLMSSGLYQLAYISFHG